jgi:hypothetical protein
MSDATTLPVRHLFTIEANVGAIPPQVIAGPTGTRVVVSVSAGTFKGDRLSGTAPVFLISLKSGGFGLNLTEADYCFLLDPWWNPATEAQAIDRTHRIGQDRNVMVYRLISAGTIEEKVLALQQRKAELFTSVMDTGNAFGVTLTADDIRALLDGRPECGGGVLVTASRSVIYAFERDDPNWTKAVKRAALKLVDEVRAVVA